MFNWFEKLILKRIAKRLTAKVPKIKEKGVDFIEKETKTILDKIESIFLSYLEKYKN